MTKPWLAPWKARCASSRGLRFVDVTLRGIGQVMFQDNPLSGLLFFIAIGWGVVKLLYKKSKYGHVLRLQWGELH